MGYIPPIGDKEDGLLYPPHIPPHPQYFNYRYVINKLDKISEAAVLGAFNPLLMTDR